MKHLGNGEGFTTLILTDTESRLIRHALENLVREGRAGVTREQLYQPLKAFRDGIQRATDRIKAEFDQEQKARKALKSDQAATVQKGKT
ncbi:MAG TPA: hypothetical protein VI653_00655 [Steroidobacteraceae bacterium]